MTQPVCAIVGAGEGLGQSLAAKFASNGFDLALLSRSEKGSGAAVAAATAANASASVRYFTADATDPQSLEAAFSDIGKNMGDIEVLIYNARGGYSPINPLDMSYDQLNEIYQLEVIGAFAAAKAVMPAMIERGRGTVLFSSATAALRGSGNNPLYAIGKFGLRALSQSLTKAYAKDGVHIVHIRLDCSLDVPEIRKYFDDKFTVDDTSNTDDVAETYWWVHQQPKSAWSNEVELRPYTENWTY